MKAMIKQTITIGITNNGAIKRNMSPAILQAAIVTIFWGLVTPSVIWVSGEAYTFPFLDFEVDSGTAFLR